MSLTLCILATSINQTNGATVKKTNNPLQNLQDHLCDPDFLVFFIHVDRTNSDLKIAETGVKQLMHLEPGRCLVARAAEKT